jgi:DNA-3-methyladenine glycosylase
MKPPVVTPPVWLSSDAVAVAPRLLGCLLEYTTAEGTVSGRIVEVEAYHGTADPASHAFRGPTSRTKPMFEGGGTIYVYLSYGMHRCLNVVTGPGGDGQAVLIRALEPVAGIELMTARRHGAAIGQLTNGPGKVGQALALELGQSGQRLGTGLSVVEQPALDPTQIASGPRIGISSAKDHPWRFWIRGNPYVSRPWH